MVLQKRLDYGINGYQVQSLPQVPPQVPKSAKGKRSIRKRTVDSRMCAFDLLAAVAGKLLVEGESSSTPTKTIGTPDAHRGKDTTAKEEHHNDEKPVKNKACDLGRCSERAFSPKLVSQEQVKCSQVVKSAPLGPNHVLLKYGTSNKEADIEKQFPHIDKLFDGKVIDGTVVNASNPYSLEVKMDVDAKPHVLASSDSSVKVPHCGDHILHDSFSLQCRDEKLLVDRDDDENSSGCTNPWITTNRALKHQGIGHRRIRKQLATKFWKVATTMTRDRELANTDVELKSSFRNRKICYTRQRTQRSSFKRRKIFQRCSISTSNGGINREENRFSPASINGHLTAYGSEDFHVKLRIKSFKVPELFIEIPETSTVGSLKRTVMEAVTAILGGGLRVGVLLQGKKVRDDNETLVQAGISHGNKLDDLGFTLEPNSNQAPPLLTGPEEPHLLLPSAAVEPLTRFPDVVPTFDGGKSDIRPESSPTFTGNCLESDHDSVQFPADTLSLDKTAEDARPLIAIPSMSVEALPMVPVRKPRRSDMAQRRIRRPFSVSEVEALVQAVEKLGTGRWRDVKIRAFDNAKHRTYVDLKDKWKTLVHTAKISPQQRRGEPVPQELLDRVLSAHAHWTQQQAKLQGKSPTAQSACVLI